MLKLFAALFLICCANYPVSAQTVADPMQPIQTFFKGMMTADTALIRSALHGNVLFQTIRRNGSIGTEDVNGFLLQIAQAKPGELDERLGKPVITEDAPLAQISTPYEFYYKGKFSHGGTNFFTLAMENGTYKILYVVDTRKPAKKG